MAPDRWAAAAHGCEERVARLPAWSPGAEMCADGLDVFECHSPLFAVRFLHDGAWPDCVVEYCASDPPACLLQLQATECAALPSSPCAWMPSWKQRAFSEAKEDLPNRDDGVLVLAKAATTAPTELRGQVEDVCKGASSNAEAGLSLHALHEWINLLGGSVRAGTAARATTRAPWHIAVATIAEQRTHEIHVDLIRPKTALEHSLTKLQKNLKMRFKANAGGVTLGKSSLRCKHTARFPVVRRREAKGG